MTRLLNWLRRHTTRQGEPNWWLGDCNNIHIQGHPCDHCGHWQ